MNALDLLQNLPHLQNIIFNKIIELTSSKKLLGITADITTY